MAKKKLVKVGILGTISDQTFIVNGVAGNWSVTVSVKLNPGLGESVYLVQGLFPKAVVRVGGVDVAVIALNASSAPTYSGSTTAPVTTVARPNQVRIEAKFVGPLIANTYPIP